MTPRRLLARAVLGLWRLWARSRARLHSLAISGSFAGFGSNTVLEPPLRLGGEARILIGSNVFIGGHSWLQTVGEGDVALEIGSGTSMSGSCVISAAHSVRIGRSVLFARNVYVSDHNHAFGDPLRPILDQGMSVPEPVSIGDGAWLGENAVVCPGVTIGRGAVIGANAVVLDDVPDFGIAVGVPARVVRQYLSSGNEVDVQDVVADERFA